MVKILSLHAEVEILSLLHIIFQRAGYEHVHTTSSEEALAILRQGDIDLLIQNLMRPIINGCDFYNLLKNDENLRHTPVLIVSAINPMLACQECRNLIDDLYPEHYLLMPFSPHVLLNIVKQILAESTQTAA